MPALCPTRGCLEPRRVRRLFSILLLATACGGPAPKAHYANGTFTKGDEHFRVAAPADWQAISPPGGDLAWRDPQSRAVIAANATCRGHHDPPLGTLVNDLLIGTTDRRYLLDETVELDGREARHEVVDLKVDGVSLVYDLYVVKKDGCVYDLTLIAPPRAYDTVADRFVAFVAGFEAQGTGRER
jgi:hypothetical protein